MKKKRASLRMYSRGSLVVGKTFISRCLLGGAERVARRLTQKEIDAESKDLPLLCEVPHRRVPVFFLWL